MEEIVKIMSTAITMANAALTPEKQAQYAYDALIAAGYEVVGKDKHV